MATPSTGVGRSIGGGGKRPGGGRPRGSRNKRTVARLAQHAENGRTDSLDFLTRMMDDDRLQMRDRVSAGIALMPYFHVRLSVMKVAPNVMTMPEPELLRPMEQIGERLGPVSAATAATPSPIRSKASSPTRRNCRRTVNWIC